jgi:response regulator RpfG family c-di-GMP phosphodiesterase
MRRHKILVVDDEVPNLRLLRRVLSEEHDIIEAQSGAEGLEVLKNEYISLIITDQRMPNMTGVQLLEASLGVCPDTIKDSFDRLHRCAGPRRRHQRRARSINILPSPGTPTS